MFAVDRGVVVAKRWPRKRPGPLKPGQAKTSEQFVKLARATMDVPIYDQIAAKQIAKNSGYIWRDVISRAMVGRLIIFAPYDQSMIPAMNVQDLLDQLQSSGLAIVQRTDTGWVAVPLGNPNQLLQIDNAGTGLQWIDPSLIQPPALDEGTYTLPILIVDSEGFISDISEIGNGADGEYLAGTGSSTPPEWKALDATALVVAGASVRLHTALSSVGIAANTTEQDLLTYTMPANTLDTNGKTLQITASGTFGAIATTRTMRLYFGTQVSSIQVVSGAQTHWRIEAEITRRASNSQIETGTIFWGAAGSSLSTSVFKFTPSITDSNQITIKVTGQNNGGQANGVVADTLNVVLQA